MIRKVYPLNFESILFYLCLGISLLAVIFNSTNPSLDGPSHLYNSQIINYLAKGNNFISAYYKINGKPVSNFSDHYLLAFLMNIFSWKTAEKILIVLYLLSFSLLFRLLVKQWEGANLALSIFAIPFSFSFLYYLGFYNFCLSFPLLFAIIIYYRKHFSIEGKKPSIKNHLLLCLLAMLIYFTSGLTFFLAGLALFMWELSKLFPKALGTSQIDIMKRPLLFLLVWIPGICCFLLSFHNTPTTLGTGQSNFSESMRWIYTVRPLVVYRGDEDKFTKYIFYLTIIALGTPIYFRYRKKGNIGLNSSDNFLFLSIIMLFGFLFIPDDASVGMMSLRLCYFFYVFLILWIAIQPGSKIITHIVCVSIFFIHFVLLFKKHQPVISDLNKEVELVKAAGETIKPNSVVLAIDVTDNWLLGHFSDYIGVDKPIVVLPNFEPDCGWFAVNWDYTTMPNILLGGKDEIPPYFGKHWVQSDKTKAIDYIFIYGDYNQTIQKPNWVEMNKILQEDYGLIYTSSNNRIHIFSLSKKSTSSLQTDGGKNITFVTF